MILTKSNSGVAALGATGSYPPPGLAGRCIKSYVSLNETGIITQLYDEKKQSVIIDTGSNAVGMTTLEQGATANSVKMLARISDNCSIEHTGWDSADDKDCMIFVVSKSVYSGGEGGTGGFRVGNDGATNGGQLNLQPYYGVWNNADIGAFPSERPATAMQFGLLPIPEGRIFSAAIVKHGNFLSHYYNGALTSSRDVYTPYESIYGSAFTTAWNNFTPNAEFSCGHGSYDSDLLTCNNSLCGQAGDPSDFLTDPTSYSVLYDRGGGVRELAGTFSGGTVNIAQEYFGLLWVVWQGGVPSDLLAAMAYMKTSFVEGYDPVDAIWQPWGRLF